MIASFFERVSTVVCLTALLAFVLGLGEVAFGLIIIAAILSPN